MGEALRDAKAINHKGLVYFEDDPKVMVGIVQMIKARMGSAVNLGDKFTAPTLWRATAATADDLTNVVQNFSNLHDYGIKPVQETMSSSLVASDSDNNVKTDKVVRAVKLLQ